MGSRCCVTSDCSLLSDRCVGKAQSGGRASNERRSLVTDMFPLSASSLTIAELSVSNEEIRHRKRYRRWWTKLREFFGKKKRKGYIYLYHSIYSVVGKDGRKRTTDGILFHVRNLIPFAGLNECMSHQGLDLPILKDDEEDHPISDYIPLPSSSFFFHFYESRNLWSTLVGHHTRFRGCIVRGRPWLPHTCRAAQNCLWSLLPSGFSSDFTKSLT